MKKVLTFGVFDTLHRGHIRLFERARKYGDYLIVAVQDDEHILKYKPDTHIVNNVNERLYMVGSIRFVDEVICYDDVDTSITKIDFDIFVKGEEQNHEGFQKAEEWCRIHSKEVVVLDRTKGISSSLIRQLQFSNDKDNGKE